MKRIPTREELLLRQMLKERFLAIPPVSGEERTMKDVAAFYVVLRRDHADLLPADARGGHKGLARYLEGLFKPD